MARAICGIRSDGRRPEVDDRSGEEKDARSQTQWRQALSQVGSERRQEQQQNEKDAGKRTQRKDFEITDTGVQKAGKVSD